MQSPDADGGFCSVGRQSAADVPIWGMFHRVSVLPAMQRDSGFYLIAAATSRFEDKGRECIWGGGFALVGYLSGGQVGCG